MAAGDTGEPLVMEKGGVVIPLTLIPTEAPPKPLSPADVKAKNDTLRLYTNTRDKAEEAIERLQSDLGAQAVQVVLTLKRVMPLIHRLIAEIEWAGSEVDHRCPSCSCSRLHGHLKGCLLAEVKKEIGGA